MAGSVHKTYACQLQFSSALERDAVHHVLFLKRVDEAGYLKTPSVLKRAIYRYEKYWLPLAAEYPNECLAAPFGIEWVWHCHMLCPKAYEQDCYAVVNRPINHTLRSPEEFKAAQLKSQSYWSKKYEFDHEPFHVDYIAPYDASRVDSFKSRLSYDILSAAQRQMGFYYEVSLPHYQDEKFLQSAIFRYRMFIYLKLQLPEEFLVPCYDIDLMWHTHQLNPFSYRNDMFRLLGKLLNHDDTTTDRSAGSKLSNATTKTREHWSNFYNESFSFFGAMYRGNPPAGFLYKITPDEVKTFSTKSCSVIFDPVTLNISPTAPRSYKNIAMYGYRAANDIQESRMFKWRMPKSSPAGSAQIVWRGKRIAYSFDGRTSNNIKFSIKEKTGLCFGSKIELGSNCMNFIQYLEAPQSLQNGGNFRERIQVGPNFSLDVNGQFSSPKCSEVVLNLQPGKYEKATVPENIQHLWGPVSLERLPQGVSNNCQVASHSLTNHLGNIEFTVRTIHSTPLMMSVVQVFYHDKMAAIAHIIASDQLPLPTQVNNRDGNMVTLNPKQGERAVLIKNNGGDWGIITGRWDGYRQGVPPGGGAASQHGNPGTLRVKFFSLPSHGGPVERYLRYQSNKFDFKLASADVDLGKGSIVIEEGCDEVAENIALAFSVSLLHVLCVPRPKSWKEGDRVKPVATTRGTMAVTVIPSDDLALVLAAGLLISAPSNYYFQSLHGHNMCAMCGGGAAGYDFNDPYLQGSMYGYGHDGTGCGGTYLYGGCSGGCGGCAGACGPSGCVGGCSGGCGSGCGGDGGGCGGGCGGCGGGCGGCG